MAIDPRLELARRMAGTSGGGSDIKSRAASQYAALKNRKKATETPGGGPGGWQGILAAGLDNPVAKAALAPLSVLDKGRSSIISGIKELSDAVDFNPNTKASLGQFSQQAQEGIGFGDVFQTGNKWVDRAVGFIGDVAFDPLTYLTLGTGHLAGLAGRTTLAAELAAKGAAKTAAGEISKEALEELVQRAGKRGLGKLTPAERASFGLPKAGLYFGAPFAKEAGKGVYLGGEKFAGAVGGGIASAKGGIVGSKALEPLTMTREGVLRKAPTGLEEVFTKLATGRGNISATQAASVLGGVTEKAAKSGAFAGVWSRVADDLLKDINEPEKLTALTHAVEAGATDPVAGSFRKFFDDVRTAWMAETGKDIGNVPNFVPHQWTEFGRQLLGGETEIGKGLRKAFKITVDEVQKAGPTFERKIVPGTYKILDKEVTFNSGTIKEIGDVLKANFPDTVKEPVLEDNFRKIVGTYVNKMGRGAGDAALEKRLLDLGVATGRSDAMHLVVDKAGTKAANQVMVEEFKTVLDGGKKALDLAKTDAKASVKAALGAVTDTLKMKVAQLRTTDRALVTKWEKISSQLASDTLSFDAKSALLNSAELELRDQLDSSVSLVNNLKVRIEADIAQNGADDAVLNKVRLTARNEAKKALAAAEGKLQHITAQMEAYNSMANTVDVLKNNLKEYTGTVKPSEFSPEGAKGLKSRTVSKQATLDTSGTVGNEIVDQTVRLGTANEPNVGFMKKLKIDDKAAGGALRQSIGIAGRVLDERFHGAVVSVKGMIDQYYRGLGTVTESQLTEEFRRIETITMKVQKDRNRLTDVLDRKAKGLGSEKDEAGRFISGTSTSDSAIAKIEKAIRDGEGILARATQNYNTIAEELASGVKAGFVYNAELPGTVAEQFSKKLDSEIKKVVESVVATSSSEVSAQAGVRQGQMVQAMFDSMRAQAEVGTRPSGAAYLSAAQMNLEKATFDARIATDFGNRFNGMMREIEKTGRVVTSQENLLLQDITMREVLASEKRALQTSEKELIASIEHYVANAKVPNRQAFEQTKIKSLAKKDARTTWAMLQPILEEVYDAGDELTQFAGGEYRGMTSGTSRELFGKTEEITNSGYSIVSGSSFSESRRRYTQAVNELQESMLLIIFPDDRVAREAYAKSGEFKRLLRDTKKNLGPRSANAWTEEIARIRASQYRPTGKAAQASGAAWSSASARAGEKQLEVIGSQIDELTKQIDGLSPIAAQKVSDPANKATIAFFEEEAGRYKQQLAQLNAVGTRQGAEVDRLKGLIASFTETANVRRTQGRVASSPKFSAASILRGDSSKIAGVANKEAQTLRTAVIKLELEMQKIFSDGALSASVKDVPGRSTIFNKAKDYIDNIDRDLAIMRDRAKRATKETKAEIATYAVKLRKERKILVNALDSATPLEDRVISAKVVLNDAKQAVKNLTGKTAEQAEIAGRTARLRAQSDAVAAGQTIRETTLASNIARVEAERATYRETYDATIPATRDAMKTIEDSRANIEALLPAMEEQVRNLPKTGSADTAEKLAVLHNYIGDSYDLLDPEGLAARLLDRPGDLTPEMLKPSNVLNLGVSNPELVAYLKSIPDEPAVRASLALIHKAHDDMGKMLAMIDERDTLRANLKTAKAGELVSVMTEVVKDGVRELADSGLYVPQEVAEAMQRLITLNADNKNKWLQVLTDYTDIWKAVKTTSPRFHIRNAMSATFMNFVGDVSFDNMKLGTKYWQAFEADPKGWLSRIPANERPYVQQALEDVFGSGGGEYSQVASKGSKAPTKGIFRYSRNFGGKVEGAVRMGMALDSRLPKELGGKGFSRDLSVGRIEKFHFNYGKLSQFDKNAKAFIPFWTFMSRNMPLQVEQMWLSPKAYATYNSVVRNARDEEPGDVTPQYISEIQGFKLPFGNNLYATPDIGMNRVAQDIEQLRDPMRLAQNLNPVFKTGLELAMGKQFYKDIPIDKGYVPLEGISRVAEPGLRLFGMTEDVNGKPFISGATQYGLQTLVPGVQEFNRFIAPNTESAKQKQGQNLLSFFTGAPFTKVTESQIQAEKSRVSREKAKKEAKRKALLKAANK